MEQIFPRYLSRPSRLGLQVQTMIVSNLKISLLGLFSLKLPQTTFLITHEQEVIAGHQVYCFETLNSRECEIYTYRKTYFVRSIYILWIQQRQINIAVAV